MVMLQISQKQSQLYTISGITAGGQWFMPYSDENKNLHSLGNHDEAITVLEDTGPGTGNLTVNKT